MRTFALLGRDDDLGQALVVVGFIAVGDAGHSLEWVPGTEPFQGAWQRLYHDALEHTDRPWADIVEDWLDRANGLIWDLRELDAPATGDPRRVHEVVAHLTDEALVVTTAV